MFNVRMLDLSQLFRLQEIKISWGKKQFFKSPLVGANVSSNGGYFLVGDFNPFEKY